MRGNFGRVLVWAALIVAAPSLLSACGKSKLNQFGQATPDGVNGECSDFAALGPSVSAFACTLYPKLMSSPAEKGFGCYSCHANPKSSAPQYLSYDPVDAHDLIIGSDKVNLQKPELSAIINKMKVERHNCNESCDAWIAETLTAISQWNILRGASAEDTGPSIVKWKTSEIEIIDLKVPGIQASDPAYQANLTKPASQLMSFDISTPVNAGGAKIEVTVERISKFGWLMHSPTIKSSKPVRIKAMAVLVNDANLPNNATWRRFEAKVAANSTTTCSTSTLVFDEMKDASVHKISLGFEVIEETTADGAKTAAQRFTDAKAVISAKCIVCHGGSGGINLNPIATAATEAVWTDQNMPGGGDFAGQKFAISGASAANSPIYRLIKGMNLPALQTPMPNNGAAQEIRDADAAIILDFLSKVGQP